MNRSDASTDWLGLLLSLLVPGVVVAGLVGAALQPGSWEDTPAWGWGLFALIPLEGFRAFVMGVTYDIYRKYHGPWQAVVSFLSAMGLIAGFVLVVLLLPGRHNTLETWRDLAAAFLSPLFWQVVLIPIALTVADAAIGLLLFRGDARAQAARVEAAGKTSGSWFMAALVYPAIYVAPVAVILLRFGSSRIVDPIFHYSRSIMLLYAALYFAGKAILLAYLHTARFLRTGRLPISIQGEKQQASEEAPTLREIMDHQNSLHSIAESSARK